MLPPGRDDRVDSGLARAGDRSPARRTAAVIALLVLLTAAFRGPMLGIPFERDEGEYAYIAWRLTDGELPYRDWVDQKPPGVFAAYRLALVLPVDPIRAAHLMALLWSAGTACALFLVARRFLAIGWAALAAGAFAVLSADPRAHGNAANTEVFMLLPLVLAQLAFLRTFEARNAMRFMLLCGVATGIATAFKQVAAVHWLLLILLHPVLATGDRRESARFALWSTAGALLVWMLIAVHFAVHGALGDMVHDVFTHNFEYVQAVPWPNRIQLLERRLSILVRSHALVWLLAAWGIVALVRARAGRSLRPFWFVAPWLLTSFLGVSASGYYFAHYFQQLLPPLALTAAFGARAFDEARFWKRVPAWARRGAVALVLFALPVVSLLPFMFVYTPSEAVRKIYPGSSFAEAPEIARRIASLTKPEDRIFILGAEPEILFYARRASATRYIFLFPLYGPYADARERQMKVVNEIISASPKVAVHVPNRLLQAPGSEQFLTRWSLNYFRENFRMDSYLTGPRQDSARFVIVGDDPAVAPPRNQPVHAAVFVRR